jgi:ribonuclease VapC
VFVDASAITAIIAGEHDGDDLAARLQDARRVYVSPLALYEALLGLARIGGMPPSVAHLPLDHFLAQTNAHVMPITAEIGRGATAAFERFGKGRHPAALNMGDCFAYACAKSLGVRLLCKGEDFARTDLALA